MATALAFEPRDIDHPDLRAMLVERAKALVPALRTRTAETEKARRIPDATVADLREAGLLRVSVPAQYGGYPGIEYDLVLEIAHELARGCPSTAWCYTIWQSHNLTTATMQPDVRAEYYSAGPDVISSTARMVAHEDVAIADGGLRVSGRWKFSSGSDHASWYIIMTKGLVGLFVRRGDVEVVDDWNPMGLRGTGSNDIVLKDVFVPANRIWGLFDAATTMPPVWITNERFSERVEGPMYAYTALSVVIGAAQGAVEAFTARFAGTRTRPMLDDVTAETPGLQLRLADASSKVDAARLIMLNDCREILRRGATDTPIPAIDRARFRRNMAFASELAVDAASRLFDMAGGRGISEGDALQRYYRDVVAGAHHASLPRDRLNENYGRQALGLGAIPDHIGSLYHPSMMPDFFAQP